jgi:hypothetical protein
MHQQAASHTVANAELLRQHCNLKPCAAAAAAAEHNTAFTGAALLSQCCRRLLQLAQGAPQRSAASNAATAQSGMACSKAHNKSPLLLWWLAY